MTATTKLMKSLNFSAFDRIVRDYPAIEAGLRATRQRELQTVVDEFVHRLATIRKQISQQENGRGFRIYAVGFLAS